MRNAAEGTAARGLLHAGRRLGDGASPDARRASLQLVRLARDAVGVALVDTPDDGQVIVTGSLYTVGAARSVLVRA